MLHCDHVIRYPFDHEGEEAEVEEEAEAAPAEGAAADGEVRLDLAAPHRTATATRL